MKTNAVKITIFSNILLIFLSCRVPSEDECRDRSFQVTIVQEGSDILKAEVHSGIGPYEYEWSNGLSNFSQISVSQSGYYSVTVTDFSSRCKASAGYQFTASQSGDCGTFTSVSDVDQNLYDIVTIGTQCWMKSNVNIETGISKITDKNEWVNSKTAAWCYYDNDINNGPKYQKLYNWYAVKSGKLCPQGWHVPTMAEWEKLITYLKNDSLAIISMIKQDPLWKVANSSSNESQFSALPGGRRQTDGSFVFEGTEADFWASDESQSGYTQAITLRANATHINRIGWSRNNGFSCRCVKN